MTSSSGSNGAPSASRPAGLRDFLLMWAGQVISLIGSRLTSFAIGVWVYNETGNVTLFTLIATSAALPGILLSPVAGVLVDRFERKWMLIVSDTGAALSSVGLLVLFATGSLELWHIYVLVGINAAFNAIQFPAFSASITMLIPKRHLGRASGMVQFGFSGAQVLGPLIAGFLMVYISIPAIIGVDLATFGVAVLLLLFVTVPPPKPIEQDEVVARPSFWKQVRFGWDYIRDRPPLVALLAYFAFLNLILPMALVLVTPMVLSFTDADELGLVLSISSAGLLVGSFAMSAWGGPRRRILGVLGFAPFMSIGLAVAGLRPSVPVIAGGMFFAYLMVPVINGSSQALWQSKVAPAAQGRVFATRRMVAQITAPLGYFLGGPLSEQVFVPLLEPGGALADTFVGQALGTGPGRGIGLLFLVMAVGFGLVTLIGACYPRLRSIEEALPDELED